MGRSPSSSGDMRHVAGVCVVWGPLSRLKVLVSCSRSVVRTTGFVECYGWELSCKTSPTLESFIEVTWLLLVQSPRPGKRPAQN